MKMPSPASDARRQGHDRDGGDGGGAPVRSQTYGNAEAGSASALRRPGRQRRPRRLLRLGRRRGPSGNAGRGWAGGCLSRPVQFGSTPESYRQPLGSGRSATRSPAATEFASPEDSGVARCGHAAGRVCRGPWAAAPFRWHGPGALRAIARTLRARRFRRGEVLFHEGDPGDALFVVASGAVKVVVRPRTERKPSWPRCGAAISWANWPCSTGRRDPQRRRTRAHRDFGLPRERFLASSPPSRRFATRSWLAGRRAAAADHSRRRAALPGPHGPAGRAPGAPGRGERRASGRRERPAGRALTQSDLASMIGATRQSVNKLLGEFEADGLLLVERDSIVVPNLERLARAARR